MDYNKNNEMTFMKYLIDGIPPEIARKAQVELGESEEVRAESLKNLRSLIKNEPDLHSCMEDTFLLRFLRSKKYRVEKAFKTLKNFYTYKATYSGILTDFRPSEVLHILKTNYFTALEYRDSGYAGIGVIRMGEIDLSKITTDEMMACILVMAEIGINMESIQVAGYAVILDFEGVTIQTVKQFASPTFLYRVIQCIQDVIPCRIKGYHIVNQPYFFNIILAIARTFLSAKLSSRLHLHGSNLKSLYKYVPQEILPEELGGKQGPISKFLEVYSKKFLSMEDHFTKMIKFGYQGKTLEELQKDNPHAVLT
ncbi:alpha-tocopherol transfer protein-like isoform X2 [Parasteatoda tepidariorum]|uniref:alpha-tocopherol transfer protein-like isoform X2 n=1 Tax=Parasteatoda tepidariorum TaxID=114398 RepID=UPI00077FAAF1|nr:alpha-tocopherol transfer protein-like isoform X2 [Parasteatoda tepidariorum]